MDLQRKAQKFNLLWGLVTKDVYIELNAQVMAVIFVNWRFIPNSIRIEYVSILNFYDL